MKRAEGMKIVNTMHTTKWLKITALVCLMRACGIEFVGGVTSH